MNNEESIEFTSIIEEATKGGAFVRVPIDIKKQYGKGRLKVKVSFEGIIYTGSIVNMGIKNSDGSVCYILGVLKEIRTTLNKNINDELKVTIVEIL